MTLSKMNTALLPALIIGNGPSVDHLDPALFDRCVTYGCNHIYKKFSVWDRETQNVVITDSNRIDEIGDAYRNFQGKLFVGDQRYLFPPIQKIRAKLGRDFIPLRRLAKQSMPVNWMTERIRFSHYLFSTVFDNSRFTFDLSKGLNFGPSVVISAIQLAVIAGHKKILLTGVDSHYSQPKSYFTGMAESISYVNSTFIANPRLFMEPVLVIAQIYLEDMGVSIIDCTPGGALKHIPKGNLLEQLT